MDMTLVETYFAQKAKRKDGNWVDVDSGKRIAAILLVHVLGYAADLDQWQALGESLDIPIVEDAAEALGSKYHGQHLGTFGKVGCLSFNGNKVMTTGGGGAMITNDAALAKQVQHLRRRPVPMLSRTSTTQWGTTTG